MVQGIRISSDRPNEKKVRIVDFGDTLTEILRKYQGERSLREYARLLGVDHSTLSVVFNTDREPSTFILAALARTFPPAAGEIAAALADTTVGAEREQVPA